MIDPIAVTSGIAQTGLYIDFFYVYVTRCVMSPSPMRFLLGKLTCLIYPPPRHTRALQSIARAEIRAPGMKGRGSS